MLSVDAACCYHISNIRVGIIFKTALGSLTQRCALFCPVLQGFLGMSKMVLFLKLQ